MLYIHFMNCYVAMFYEHAVNMDCKIISDLQVLFLFTEDERVFEDKQVQ